MESRSKPLLPYAITSSRLHSPDYLSRSNNGVNSLNDAGLTTFLNHFKRRRFFVLLIGLGVLYVISGSVGRAEGVGDESSSRSWKVWANDEVVTKERLEGDLLQNKGLPPPTLEEIQRLRGVNWDPEGLSPAKSPSDVRNDPLTVLGYPADDSYKLGSTSISTFQTELEDFIRKHFPASDSNEQDPHSLLNDMRQFFPASSASSSTTSAPLPEIPEKFFQTAATPHSFRLEATRERRKSWQNLLPNWNFTLHDNLVANDWVLERFKLRGERDQMVDGDAEREVEIEERGIVAAWKKMASPPVLRSDFWRYLVVATEGGVYADTDVEGLHHVDQWALNPSWDTIPKDYVSPSFICGIEADVGDRPDWAQWYSRPVQISQWTFAAARGHPILIDALRRVVEDAFTSPPPGSEFHQKAVIERTGPGPFSDSVFRYLKSKFNVEWPKFQSLGEDGWREYTPSETSSRESELGEESLKDGVWGDVKMLSITGFSPDSGHMGSLSHEDRSAMVVHGFDGSWKEQPGTQGE